MSSGRAVEKPRPMIGLAVPSAGLSGMTSSCQAAVVFASALLHVPSLLLSRRKLPSPLTHAGFVTPLIVLVPLTVGNRPVAGLAARLTSAQSQLPSPFVSV